MITRHQTQNFGGSYRAKNFDEFHFQIVDTGQGDAAKDEMNCVVNANRTLVGKTLNATAYDVGEDMVWGVGVHGGMLFQ